MHGFAQDPARLLASILLSGLLLAGSGSVLAQVTDPFADLRVLDYGPENTAQALEIRARWGQVLFFASRSSKLFSPRLSQLMSHQSGPDGVMGPMGSGPDGGPMGSGLVFCIPLK